MGIAKHFVFGLLILVCWGFSAHAQQSSQGDAGTLESIGEEGQNSGLIVGRSKCLNSTNDGFGEWSTFPPAPPNYETVIECEVPSRYNSETSFLKIAVTLNESCKGDQIGTRVQVGSVFAEPNPNGDFFSECYNTALVTRTRIWYTVPTTSIKAGDKILVQAGAWDGWENAEIGPVRAIMVELFKVR